MVTAIAFAYFARHNCDIVVCEVGMGGEFDATNVIPAPEAAVFCNIGLDHTQYLGTPLKKNRRHQGRDHQARLRGGAVPPDGLCGGDHPPAVRASGLPLHLADFDGIRPEKAGLEGQVFDWGGACRPAPAPAGTAPAVYNAAVALTAIRCFRPGAGPLPTPISAAAWRPPTGPAGSRSSAMIPVHHRRRAQSPVYPGLEQNIRDYLPDRPLTVLTGVMQDKDYHCMYRGVVPYANPLHHGDAG